MVVKKIEEKIPKDMAMMYRRDTQKLDHHRYGADDIDYEKAEYREITPEEAINIRKSGESGTLRILYGDDYALYRNDGYCIKNIQLFSKYSRDAYQTRSGKTIIDFRDMPFSHVVKIASKIYATNEESPEAKIDDEKLKRRELTRDFRHNNSSWYYGGYGSEVYANGSDKTGAHSNYSYNDRRRNVSRIHQINKEIQILKAKYDAGDISKNDYERAMASYNDAIKGFENDIANNRRTKKAGSTANKYQTAVAQNNINKFRSLKYAIQSNERIINDLNAKIADINTQGKNSKEFSYERDQLVSLRKKLASIQSEIEYYENRLSDDATSREVAQATNKLNIATSDLSNVKAELNKLLKREGLEHVKEKMLAESFQDDIFNKVWDTLETLSSQEIFTLMSNWFGNLENDGELVEFANDELSKLDNETLEDAVTSVRGETAAHFFVNYYGRGEFGTEEFAKYMEDEGYEI